MAMSETVSAGALYRLMAWLSPAYPTGAYSYSHGIEAAVEQGLVDDRATLVSWCAHIVRHGAGWIDAVLLVNAHAAAVDDDWDRIAELAALAAALRGTRETGLESVQQGSAFLAASRSAWPSVRLERLAALRAGKAIALPIAVGVAAAEVVPPTLIVAGYLQSFAANLVSAAVRLIPLGQTDGQRAIAELAQTVAEAADAALARVCAAVQRSKCARASALRIWPERFL